MPALILLSALPAREPIIVTPRDEIGGGRKKLSRNRSDFLQLAITLEIKALATPKNAFTGEGESPNRKLT
jgi:hypothetical protein